MTASESTRVLEDRIRTLEDALRPFATGDGVTVHRKYRGACEWCTGLVGGLTSPPRVPWPCKYETARRALEGNDG